jgi:acetylglutamate kinase
MPPHRQASRLMADLTALEVPVAISNALAVHPAGVIGGIDQEFTGRIERVDVESLQALLKADIIPLLHPIGYDGRGTTLRFNSDAVAVEVAIALRAAKVIFVAEAGLSLDGQRLAQISAIEARQMAKQPANPDRHQSRSPSSATAASPARKACPAFISWTAPRKKHCLQNYSAMKASAP